MVGDARIASADASNTIRLNAGQAIGITLPTGSLAVLDGAGNPTGAIDLTAPRITVATPSAAADILAATTTAARMVRLATNDGQVNDRGALAAGQLTFRIRDALHIQNTGGAARADRRGFSAGSGGVSIVATGTGQPEFVVNGRIGSLTGDAVLSAIRLSNASDATGASLFVGASSANDCTLVQGYPVPSAPSPPLLPPTNVVSPVIGVPVQDVVGFIVDDPEDSQAVEQALRFNPPQVQAPLIELAPSQPFSFVPPVDEPVTGSGNDSLWTGIGIGNAVDGGEPEDGAVIGTGIDRDGANGPNTGTGDDKDGDSEPSPRPYPDRLPDRCDGHRN